MTRIAVVGTGYVGLATAVGLSSLGHEVVGFDIDTARIERLNAGESPILEHGLGDLLVSSMASGHLRFVTTPGAAVGECEFAFLCVPTPKGPDDRADLSFVRTAAGDIGPLLPAGAIVVTKSTVPVGSTIVVERAIARHDVPIVSNPEFLREGSAIRDFLHPDRVVVGADDPHAAARVAELYRDLNAPVLITDPASAETIKYASNAFLATKVSFVNAIANICESVGADVDDVLLGMGYDHRIGPDFLHPGPGFGGSCFPKDTAALIRIAEDAGYDFGLLKGVIRANAEQFDRVVAKVETMAGGSVEGCRIGAWGLTFKARTDDTRESPAIHVIRRLIGRGAHVRAYDPALTAPPLELMTEPSFEICSDPYAACEGATVLVLLTEWEEFRRLDMAKVAGVLGPNPGIVDARNLLDRPTLHHLGLRYERLG